MHKVIVIDDEMLIRKRIIYGFPWEELGYEIEDEAENGQQALELMEYKQYSLAIIDIAMPGINGIELAKKIREYQYRTEIIFLTGHSDFKYAQQAVKYGVYYYILKPINEEEFVSVLTELRQKMDEEISKTDLLAQLEKKQDYMDAVLQAKVFSDYFYGSGKKELFVRVMDALQEAGIQEEEYLVALLRVESFLKNHIGLSDRVKTVNVSCNDAQSENYRCFSVCDIEKDCMILILQSEEYRTEKEKISEIRNIVWNLKNGTGELVRCGVSRIHRSFEQMGEAYVEALSALNNAKMLKEDVLSYSMANGRGDVHYKISNREIKDLHAALMRNDYEGCRKIIQKIFGDMGERKATFECVVRNVDRLFIELVDAGVVSDMDTRRMLKGYHNVEKALGNMENMEEIAEWCENVIYAFIQNGIQFSQESKSLPIVEKTCEYIQKHYEDADLSQAQIAEAMAVTSPYLSGVFKKAMGISMVQYITMFRMEKAREMLLKTGKDVKEIAELVGYRDEYYFSRCFKKQYGFSPMQMRKLSDARRMKHTGIKETT